MRAQVSQAGALAKAWRRVQGKRARGGELENGRRGE